VKAKVIPIKDWLESLKEATQDLMKTSLRFDRETMNGAEGKGAGAAVASVEGGPGAYIAVLGEANAMHLGITSTPEGCRTLARGLLGMRNDQTLSDKDAVDAVSEVMNIVAGKVKSRMSDRDHSLRLGMPIFMEQPIQVREDMERVMVQVKIGPVPCQLLVFKNKKAA
jgi:CheY-specific phosphatase CheX